MTARHTLAGTVLTLACLGGLASLVQPGAPARELTSAMVDSGLSAEMSDARIADYSLACNVLSATVEARFSFKEKTGRDAIIVKGTTPCSRASIFLSFGTLVVGVPYQVYTRENYEPALVLSELRGRMAQARIEKDPGDMVNKSLSERLHEKYAKVFLEKRIIGMTFGCDESGESFEYRVQYDNSHWSNYRDTEKTVCDQSRQHFDVAFSGDYGSLEVQQYKKINPALIESAVAEVLGWPPRKSSFL